VEFEVTEISQSLILIVFKEAFKKNVKYTHPYQLYSTVKCPLSG